MQYSKLILLVGLVSISVSSCKQHQEARRPLSQKSGTFMKKSAERNKKLIAGEEGQIDSLIKSNTKIKYLASTKGYWYTYVVQNTLDTLTPKKGDVAFFNYEIKDLKGNIIYSELELRPQVYYVDKQNISNMQNNNVRQCLSEQGRNCVKACHAEAGKGKTQPASGAAQAPEPCFPGKNGLPEGYGTPPQVHGDRMAPG